jgi:hypothetical protein
LLRCALLFTLSGKLKLFVDTFIEALCDAARKQDQKALHQALELGCHINTLNGQMFSAVMLLAIENHEPGIEFLIQHGANPLHVLCGAMYAKNYALYDKYLQNAPLSFNDRLFIIQYLTMRPETTRLPDSIWKTVDKQEDSLGSVLSGAAVAGKNELILSLDEKLTQEDIHQIAWGAAFGGNETLLNKLLMENTFLSRFELALAAARGGKVKLALSLHDNNLSFAKEAIKCSYFNEACAFFNLLPPELRNFNDLVFASAESGHCGMTLLFLKHYHHPQDRAYCQAALIAEENGHHFTAKTLIKHYVENVKNLNLHKPEHEALWISQAKEKGLDLFAQHLDFIFNHPITQVHPSLLHLYSRQEMPLVPAASAQEIEWEARMSPLKL